MGASTERERGGQRTGIIGRYLRHYPVATFLLLTFSLTWGWWGVAYGLLTDGALSDALALPGAFGPLVAAALVTWATGADTRKWAGQVLEWRVAPRWYLIAVGLPLLVTVGGIGLTLIGLGATVTPSLLAQRLPLFPILLVFTLVLGGGQEEFGWRGFALPRLQVEYSALTASLLLGVVWAVWHLPLFLMGAPRNQTGSFLLYAILIVAVSVLLTWCYNSTGGSVLLAMVFHAAVNSSGSLLPVEMSVADQWALVIDVTSVIAMWVVALAVIAWSGRAWLSRDGIPSPSRAGVEQPK